MPGIRTTKILIQGGPSDFQLCNMLDKLSNTITNLYQEFFVKWLQTAQITVFGLTNTYELYIHFHWNYNFKH